MTKEDILHALRLTAMGRTGHPLQDQLAEKLAEVLMTPAQRAESEMVGLKLDESLVAMGKVYADAAKRRKKAD